LYKMHIILLFYI